MTTPLYLGTAGWIALAGFLVSAATAMAAPINPDAPTTDWTAVSYPTLLPDFSDDQQTGQPEADIVGDLGTPALYMNFDDNGGASSTDGTMAFRVRLGADANPPGFKAFFGIGFDANSDGVIDLFLGVSNTGSSDEIGIYNAGSGLNTSPSTTSIVSTGVFSYAELSSNYDWSAVDGTIDPTASSFDLDNDGKTDYFLSFFVPFQDIVDALTAIGITGFQDDSQFQLIAGTSTQANALNQDLGGPNGGTSSTETWANLGAMSQTLTPLAVPEPDTGALLALGLVAIAANRRHIRR